MINMETLLDPRLTNQLLPAWPVMLYVVLLSGFVLMRRLLPCLLTTYLFTFYWGFLLHWADFIPSGIYLAAFVMYIVCGLLIACLIIPTCFSEPAKVDST